MLVILGNPYIYIKYIWKLALITQSLKKLVSTKCSKYVICKYVNICSLYYNPYEGTQNNSLTSQASFFLFQKLKQIKLVEKFLTTIKFHDKSNNESLTILQLCTQHIFSRVRKTKKLLILQIALAATVAALVLFK